MAAPKLKLLDGNEMPIVGLGTWKSAKGEVTRAVETAIALGYRHIDCAYCYGNEAEVGAGIKAKIDDGTVTRGELFVVSKLWNTYHRKENVEKNCRMSLQLLGLDYIDLYLIHWPHAFKSGDENFPRNENGDLVFEDTHYLQTWQGMEGLVDKGLVKSIGISNFNRQQTEDVLKNCRIKPTCNQIEVHPYFSQIPLTTFCQEHGVQVTAYSPLGSADRPWATADDPVILEDPKLKELGTKYGKSPAQIILRWLIQRNIIVIPKSVTPSRIQDNFNVFDFELSENDMAAVHSFNRDERLICPMVTVDGERVYRDRNAPYYPFHKDIAY